MDQMACQRNRVDSALLLHGFEGFQRRGEGETIPVSTW